jgi:methionyl-tRNA formyltransferase
VRIVFFGTPEFAVPALDAIAAEHEVVLVVAQPDKPSGRGMKMHAPAAAVRARELGLPLLQPARIRNEEFLSAIRDVKPDAGVVIAYGRILPAALLEIPKHGFFNVHGSILPSWRGAAPIQRAIEAGDVVTGVTIMRVDEELDHGAMLEIVETPIGPQERMPEVAKRLSALGAEAMTRVLRCVGEGTAVDTEQDHARATVAPKIEKGEAEVTFAEPARVIYDRFRAFYPWPGIFVMTAGESLKLTDIAPAVGSGRPREILEIGDEVVIACGESALRVRELQRPGKSRSQAGAIARGLGWREGELLP